MENNYNIDDHLKRTLEELEVQPDIRSFHEVMRKMNEKKKRRRFIIFFWFGLLLFGAYTFTIFNTFFNEKKNVADTITSKTNHSIVEKNKINIEKTVITPPKELTTSNTNFKQQQKTIVIAKSSEEKTYKTKNPVIKDPFSKANTSANNSTTINSINVIENNTITSKNASSAANEEENKNEGSISDQEVILFLPIKNNYLSIDSTQKELLTIISVTLDQIALATNDSLKDKNKKIHFYIVINLEPKLSSFLYSKNTDRNAVYNDGSDFSEQYLKEKKAQSAFRFNYAFGVKAGLNIHEKYEVFIGFGFQNFKEAEELYNYNGSSPVVTHPPTQNSFATYDASASSKNLNNFNYYYYSIDVSRIYKLSEKVHYKAGLGFQANQLRYASFVFVTSPNTYRYSFDGYTPISKWAYTANFKAGLMFDAGKRWQFQLCPNLFYSPSSIYKKDYVIKERPYGLSMECMILFRLF